MSKLATNEDRIAFLNAKAEEVAQREVDALVIDFDQALAEQAKKPIKVKFNGAVYQVPDQMPFKFAMFYFRHCHKKSQGQTVIEVPEEKMTEFIQLMFGQKFLDAIEETDVPVNFVFDTIAARIMARWGYETKGKGNPSKNVQTPGS